LNEEQLISRLKEGDTLAFKELVDELKNRVFNTALGILQNTEDAEDTTQEVFIEVFHSIGQFKGDSKMTTWVYRITVTKALDFLRKKKRKKRFALTRILFATESVEPVMDVPHFYHPGVQLENKERASILFSALDRLPENQKSAFILHKVEGLSYQEVAEVLKVSVSSVESLMYRARQGLQKLLMDYYQKNEK
jgi:RNA polymerase sigma factor (sigma-70 family)